MELIPYSTTVLLQGLVFGIMIAAPVGALGMLCVWLTVNRGFARGITCGLGAACGDVLYVAIVLGGLFYITDWLARNMGWVEWVGAVMLCTIGLALLIAPALIPQQKSCADNEKEDLEPSTGKTLKTLGAGFALALANPGTLISVPVLLASTNLTEIVRHGWVSACGLVIAIFCGALIAYGAVCGLAHQFHGVSPLVRARLRTGLAALILLYGIGWVLYLSIIAS